MLKLGKGARERHGSRLTLDLVVPEEVSTVADDWPAKGGAHLLVRVGHHALLDEIGGVEAIVPKKPDSVPANMFVPGFRDGVRQHPAERPCEASKRLVTSTNSAIASMP